MTTTSRSEGAGNVSLEETLWDANDVARYLKVSRSWVYRAAESGALPHLRVGALLRFLPGAVRAFACGEKPLHARVVPFPSR